jgi:hypothetical protein
VTVPNFSTLPEVLQDRVRRGLEAAVGLFLDHWTEWGVIEYVYARANPVDFAHVIDLTIGHRVQIERGLTIQVGKYAEQEMSNAILSRFVGSAVDRFFADRTGAWAPVGELMAESATGLCLLRRNLHHS